jgi:hypothetical protein
MWESHSPFLALYLSTFGETCFRKGENMNHFTGDFMKWGTNSRE